MGRSVGNMYSPLDAIGGSFFTPNMALINGLIYDDEPSSLYSGSDTSGDSRNVRTRQSPPGRFVTPTPTGKGSSLGGGVGVRGRGRSSPASAFGDVGGRPLRRAEPASRTPAKERKAVVSPAKRSRNVREERQRDCVQRPTNGHEAAPRAAGAGAPRFRPWC